MTSSLRAWRRTRVALAATVVLGVMGMLLAHRAVSAWTRARMAAEFERRARMVLGPLQAELDASLELTQSMADVFGADLPISRDLFDTVTRGARARHTVLQALQWVPRVPRGSEAPFEEGIRREVGEFGIADYPGAAPVPGADRFPVAYVSPRDSNRTVLGLDLGSEPARRRALEAAVETGVPS